MKNKEINHGMTRQEMMDRGPCPHADIGRPLSIEAVAAAFEKADPGGVKAHELAKKYQDHKCQVCGKKIEMAICQTHEEAYEIGHGDNCSYKQTIKEGCVIE